MQDLLSMMSTLHRPRLLVRAARLGSRDYRRDCHLPRLLGYGTLPRSAVALMRLMEQEREINESRLSDDAGYSLPRHLDILIAMMGEAQRIRATQPSLNSAAT
jgi:uncharacterized protein DUF6477